MLTVRTLLADLGFLLLIGAAVAPRILYVRLLIGGAAFVWMARAAMVGDNDRRDLGRPFVRRVR